MRLVLAATTPPEGYPVGFADHTYIVMTQLVFPLPNFQTTVMQCVGSGQILHKTCPCFFLLCWVVVIVSALDGFLWFFTHILQGYFTGTGAIIWLPQCQWSNPEWYGQKLEQLEWLHSEIRPATPWLPILVIHIRSQVKTRHSESYTF